MFEAIIIAEPYELKRNFKELSKTLKDADVNTHTLYRLSDVPKLLKSWNAEKLENPTLIFYSPSERVPDFKALLDFLAANEKTPAISIDGKIRAFYPNKVSYSEEANALVSPGFLFKASNIKVERAKPEVELFPMFLYTHNRDLYLRLTLNSLVFSFRGMTELPPLKIFLNEATPAVREVALEFMSKHENIEVFEVTPNSYIYATNLALQMFKPKKFALLEDDFILPPITNKLYLNWPLLFSEKLEFFDVVSWPATIDNWPYNNKMSAKHLSLDSREGLWAYSYNHDMPYSMAQILATNIEHYIAATKESHWKYTAFDANLNNTDALCCPNVPGYHIGFNQEQDGFVALNNVARWGNPEEMANQTYKVVSLKTNETWKLKPEGLHNLEV